MLKFGEVLWCIGQRAVKVWEKLCSFTSKDEQISSFPFACLCRERSVIWLQAAVRLLYTWMHTTGEGVKKPCKTSCDTADCVVTSFQDFRLVVWRRLAFFSMMDIVFILFSSSLGVLSFVFDFRLPFGGRAIHALLLTFEIAFCLTLHPLLK